MTDQEFGAIFSQNLRNYLSLHNKTQADLARYVGVSTAAVNNWCKGLKLPRMSKTDKICTFFNIQRSDLMSDHCSKEYLAMHPTSAPAAAPALSSGDQELLDSYHVLNQEGQKKVRDYAADLVDSGKYDDYEKEERKSG